MTVTYTVGDTRKVIATLPDGSVDLIATSPPFLALRSYVPADHESKGDEIGSERNPAEFIDMLLGLTAEWGRVLAPHGSIAIELGDTYSGSGVAGGDYNEGGLRDGQGKVDGSARRDAGRVQYEGQPSIPGRKHYTVDKSGSNWPRAKSLALVPQLYAIALAYGINPLTGQPSPAGRWLVRNVIVWHRPNPAVGCVDAETEALTPDGWKRHDELNDGDLIAAYDPVTDSCRFQPAKFVRWHRENEPMIAIEKRKTSQRLTMDHRCLVRTGKRQDPFVVLAGDLRNDQQVLLSARLEEVPGPEPTTTERAELLGWYIAEGSPRHHQARIVQSLTTNRAKVDRIRELLRHDGADFTESTYRMTTGNAGGHILVTFTIKGELAAWLNLHHKRLPMQYVTTWPTRTLAALFAGLIDGDGHRRRDGGTLFFQKERPVCDAVQVLAVRLGLRATVSRQEPLNGWQVTIGNPEHHESSRWTNVLKWDRPRGESIPTETYTGTVWCPMVETSFWLARRRGATFVTGNSLGDKVRPSTSYIVIATRSPKRWFDLTAVRGESGANTHARTAKGVDLQPTTGKRAASDGNFDSLATEHRSAPGAPPLDAWFDQYDGSHDTWTLTTQPSKLAHYAMWPAKLAERLVLMMCPAQVCRVCGEPRRRVERRDAEVVALNVTARNGRAKDGRGDGFAYDGYGGFTTTTSETLGWTDCGCWCEDCNDNACRDPKCPSKFRPGHVLDPFAGSGTTCAVADLHGRDATGIDFDQRNHDLYPARYDEVKRALFGTVPEMPGQGDLFAEAAL